MKRATGSIANFVVVNLVGVATLFTGGVAAVFYRSYEVELRSKLDEKHAALADQLATSLVLPVWNFDRPQIDKVLESAMRDRDVSAVVVKMEDLNGSTQARMRNAQGAPILTAGEPAHAGMLEQKRDVMQDDGGIVATTTLYVTPKHLEAELDHALSWLGALVTTLGAILFLSLYPLLYKTVLGPLKELDRYAVAVAEGKGQGAMPRRRYRGELQRLKVSLRRTIELLESRLCDVRRSEQQLSRLKSYLASIIDSMPAMLIGVDGRECVTLWNHGAAAYSGIPEERALGRPLAEVLPDFYPWIRRKTQLSIERLTIERAGESRFFSLMLYPLIGDKGGGVVRIEDVTDRTRTQELMIQTEKMVSLGGLAAGMAHEINNPLGIIAQAAQNIERRVDPSLPANRSAAAAAGIDLDKVNDYLLRRQVDQFVAGIRAAAVRATHIVGHMLKFSRRADASLKLAPLGDIVDDALELAANDYDLKKRFDFRGVAIERAYDVSVPPVPVVKVEIEQVVLNLLRNAAQAMVDNPPTRQPRIALRVRKEENFAVLEVEDNGPGMPEAVRRRVFEPFFTTKEPGVGTGLGMSVSYTIVTQNHKGQLAVDSSPGRGARFTLKLPLAGGPLHA